MNVNPPPTEQFRTELERVLASNLFRNSDSVSRLLAYLGEESLAGRGQGLKEFTIGVEALKKPLDYSPREDPTVRVLASKLRRKLDDYYRTEGADHPVRIDLPKGHYLLQCELRQPIPQDASPPPASREVRRWRRLCWALAAALVVIGVLALRWRLALDERDSLASRIEAAWSPELEVLWQPYLDSDRPVLIALGTPLFTKFSGGFFRDPRLNEWEEAAGSDRVKILQKLLESSYASPWHNFTGIGEASGAFLLCKLLQARTAGLSLKRSAAFSWEDAGSHNVIFLGSPKFNPQLKDIPFEQDFVIDGGALLNLRPRAGEPEKFSEIWTPSHSALLEDHALVTRLPGLHGHGEITVLASSSTEGTWAAAEYVTRPQHARGLVAKLSQTTGEMPGAYQVVIRAKYRDQVPIETSYVTHRVLREHAAGMDR